MESATTKYQTLIEMMEAFVSGQGRSRDFVRQMEGEFATSDLDDDERFSDLGMALACLVRRIVSMTRRCSRVSASMP